jgi:hypothetical protein
MIRGVLVKWGAEPGRTDCRRTRLHGKVELLSGTGEHVRFIPAALAKATVDGGSAEVAPLMAASGPSG